MYTAYTHARTRNRARARKITISGHRGHAGVAASRRRGDALNLCLCPTTGKQIINSGMIRSTMRRHPAPAITAKMIQKNTRKHVLKVGKNVT